MTFVVIARYRCLAGAEGTVADALAQMVPPSRAEPGNLAYVVCRAVDDPAQFVIYEEYADETAFTAHTETPHFERWLRGAVLPNLAERQRHTLSGSA